MRPYTLAVLKTTNSANKDLTTCRFAFDYFNVWDRRQLNPTYTCRKSRYRHRYPTGSGV